jgi:hypothetical protein
MNPFVDNLKVEYLVERIGRSAKTRWAFGIHFHAHNLFRVVADLERILGSTQYPMQESVPVKTKDKRPWFFGFVTDTIHTDGTHDGRLGLRLYVNDETIAEYFDMLCAASYPYHATITVEPRCEL